MNKIKKFSLIVLSAVLFVCSAFVFAGCKEDDDTCKLYVFASVGGYVQVNDSTEYVKFGDEGSKVFTFKEDSDVKLTAVPDLGYKFTKWKFTQSLEQKYNECLTQPELDLHIEDDEIVVKAEFELDDSVVIYNVTYPTNTTGYTFTLENGYSTPVIAGGDFKFKISLWADYSNSNIIVKANGVEIDANSQGVYTISNINAHTSIIVEGVELNETEDDETQDPVIPEVIKYGIYADDNKFNIIPINPTSFEVESGKSFVFKIQLSEGYKFGSNVVVKAVTTSGEEVLTKNNNNEYTIHQVLATTEIKVDGIEIDIEDVVPTSYTISTTDTKFTILPVGEATGKTSWLVEENTNFTFTIALKDGYKFGTSVQVKAITSTGEQILTSSNNQYTINSVATDITIQVTGIELITHTISTNDARITIVPVNPTSFEVENGNNFVFTISVTDAKYNIDNIIVKANGSPLTNISGKYTIEQVTEDIVITFEGIVENVPTPTSYTVSTTDTKFTILPVGETTGKASWEVEENNDFTFTLELKNGYKFGASVQVKAITVTGEQVLTPSNNKYTISSVTADVTIQVTGIELITYTISTDDTRFAILPVGEATGKASWEVGQNSNFVFTVVALDDEYNVDNLIVKVDGNEVNATSGRYAIAQVVKNMKITFVVIYTHTFALDFEDSVNNLMPDLSSFIPETITINVTEDEIEQTEYSADEFIIIADQEQKSIKNLIDSINEEYSLSTVSQFTIGGLAFIVVEGENITINWSVLDLVDLSQTLIIEM